MKILFFTELSPFPINGGERIRSYGLLKALATTGHKVIAAVQNRDEVDISKYRIEGVEFFLYKAEQEGLFRRILLLQYLLPQPKVVSSLKFLLEERKPDIIFIDYGFLGHYISLFKQFNIPVVYGTHNSQSQLTLQRPSPGLFKFIRKWQRVAMEMFHERKFLGEADALVVVSEADKKYHSQFIKSDKVFVIPNFLDEDRYTKDDTVIKDERLLVMTANFNAFMNFEGVKWFLSKVWNDSLDQKWRLCFVGKGSEFLTQRIPVAKRFNNIEFLGPVDDVIPYLRKASALVIPLLHGSGSRLKCLEAMALKIPVISTPKGVEGIKSDSFIVASGAKAFQQILCLNDFYSAADVEGAYRDFLEEYCIVAVGAKLKDIVSFVSV